MVISFTPTPSRLAVTPSPSTLRALWCADRARRAAEDAAWQRLCHALGRARDHHLSLRRRDGAGKPESDHQGAACRDHSTAHRGDPRSAATEAGVERLGGRGRATFGADRRRKPAHWTARACREHVRTSGTTRPAARAMSGLPAAAGAPDFAAAIRSPPAMVARRRQAEHPRRAAFLAYRHWLFRQGWRVDKGQFLVGSRSRRLAAT